jgi:hypothetical protein
VWVQCAEGNTTTKAYNWQGIHKTQMGICLFWASKIIWTLSIFFELEQSKFTGHQNWMSNGIISSKLFLYHLAAFSISWFRYCHWKEYYFEGVQSSGVRVRKSEMFWERHVIECQVMMTEQIAQLDIWPCLMHRNIIPLTAHLDLSWKECALATSWAWETHLSDQENMDT